MNLAIDFSKTAQDYAKHRVGFPSALIARLKPFAIGIKGQKVLDIGTGTGSMARLMAMEGCSVTAHDPSEKLIEQAKIFDKQAQVKIHYQVAQAENIPSSDAAYDVVMAGQCWHWFDGTKAAKEIDRVLKPNGKILICHFDWLPISHSVAQATEAIILKYNPSWRFAGGSGFYPRWLADISEAGFSNLETFSFDLDIPYSHEDWCGRIRASAGVAASLSPAEVTEFDREHKKMLKQSFPEDPFSIPHRVWAVIGCKSF